MLSRSANLFRFCRDAGKTLTTEMIPAQRQMASSSHLDQDSYYSQDQDQPSWFEQQHLPVQSTDLNSRKDNAITKEDIKEKKEPKYLTKDELTEIEIVGNFYIPVGDKFICAKTGVYITHENRGLH